MLIPGHALDEKNQPSNEGMSNEAISVEKACATELCSRRRNRFDSSNPLTEQMS
jgi:hypothetical protein